MSLLSSLRGCLGQAFKTNTVSTVLVGLSSIVLVVLLSAFVLVMFCESAEKSLVQILGASEKNEVLKFLGISMGGIILALQALIANRRAKAMENTAKAQVEANKNAEQGQRQERLKNAIEHLGHVSDSVRLGGAYELFHLAEDTEEDTKDLRQTVLDILCAHIRRTTGELEYRDKYSSKPSEEIQSLLTLLFVQKYEVFTGLDINLQGSWLNGADLRGAHLEKAVLPKAYLQGVDLSGAQLQGADLSEAQLQGAVLWGTYLQGSTLRRVRLQGAQLREARLHGATLCDARLQGADLPGTQLQGAELFRTQLQGADFYRADLRGVVSQVPDLKNQFEERIASRINQNSDLTGAIFEGRLSMSREDLDALVEFVPDERKQTIRQLQWHIGKTATHEPPKNSGAITGAYTPEEAEQWISEYQKVMPEVPEVDDN